MIKKIIKENWIYLIAIALFILFALNVRKINLYKYILDLDYQSAKQASWVLSLGWIECVV